MLEEVERDHSGEKKKKNMNKNDSVSEGRSDHNGKKKNVRKALCDITMTKVKYTTKTVEISPITGEHYRTTIQK